MAMGLTRSGAVSTLFECISNRELKDVLFFSDKTVVMDPASQIEN